MIALRPPVTRFQAAPDGRIGCRQVFEYALMDGSLTPFRPRDGVPWVVVVHDFAAYSEMIRTGWIYSPAHTGRRPETIDNRRAS